MRLKIQHSLFLFEFLKLKQQALQEIMFEELESKLHSEEKYIVFCLRLDIY